MNAEQYDRYMKLWSNDHRDRPHVLFPPIQKKYIDRLAKMSSHFKFEWNVRKTRWEIIHYRANEVPYVAIPICYPDGSYRPVDERAFLDLYHAIWFSMHPSYNASKMLERHNSLMDHRTAHHEDEIRNAVRQYESVIRSIKDTKGGLHSKAHQTYKFPVGIQL